MTRDLYIQRLAFRLATGDEASLDSCQTEVAEARAILKRAGIREPEREAAPKPRVAKKVLWATA